MMQEKNIVRLGLTIIVFIALLGLVITPAPALADGKGIMVDWKYADGQDYQPGDDEVKQMRPQE